MNLFQDNNKPQITFYFAECMEFPDYGEYKEFPSLAQKRLALKWQNLQSREVT